MHRFVRRNKLPATNCPTYSDADNSSTFAEMAQFKHQKWKMKKKEAPSRSSSRNRSNNWWLFCISSTNGRVLIFALAVLCFSTSYDGDFVFDDAEAVVHNRDVRWTAESSNGFFDFLHNDFWGTNIVSNTSHKSYRPLTILSFRLNWWWSGLNPVSYHVLNIWLHGLVSLLTYEFYLRVLKSPHADSSDTDSVFSDASDCGESKVQATALMAALMFAAHPIHTECVANIVGRAELLAAVFYLLAFLIYTKFQVSEDADSCGNVQLIRVVGLGFLSMLSKEQGITVFGWCALYEVLLRSASSKQQFQNDLERILSDFRNNNWEKSDRSFLKLTVLPMVCRLGVLLLSACVMFIFRLWIMNFESPEFTPSDNPASFHPSVLMRVLNYNYVYAMNVWLLFSPVDLCFDYSMGCIPLIESLLDGRILVVLLFWTLFIAFLYFCLFGDAHESTKKLMLFSVGCIIIPFLPASNLPFRVGFVLAERVLYLPSIGFCLLVSCGLQKLAAYDNWPRCGRRLSECWRSGFLVLLLLFTAKSMQRSGEWRSEVRLYMSGLRVCPNNAKVHYNLGKVLSDAGLRQPAEHQYRHALRLHPDYEQAMNNLANLLKDRSAFKDAETLLLEAVRLRPDFAAAWMNLGIVQTAQKKYLQAELSYLTALQYRHLYPDCYFNLGNLYLELGRTSEALAAWTNATHLKPTHAKAWLNQLVLYDNQDNCATAVQLGLQALGHVQSHPGIHFSIGSCLGKMGRLKEAETYMLRATQLDPVNPSYYGNLGVLYHRWHRHAEAETMYIRALERDPKLDHMSTNLKLLRKEMQRSHLR